MLLAVLREVGLPGLPRLDIGQVLRLELGLLGLDLGLLNLGEDLRILEYFDGPVFLAKRLVLPAEFLLVLQDLGNLARLLALECLQRAEQVPPEKDQEY